MGLLAISLLSPELYTAGVAWRGGGDAFSCKVVEPGGGSASG